MKHPFLSEAFTVQWSNLKPESIVPDIELALNEAQQHLNAIIQQDSSSVTFASTFLALEEVSKNLDRAWSRLNHLTNVSDEPEQRKAYNAILPKVSEFYSSIPLNDELWSQVKQANDHIDHSALSPVEQRLIEVTMLYFKDSGADLEAEKKMRMKAIEQELAVLTQAFSERVLDSTNDWELLIDDESKLAGLPESAKAQAAASALAKYPDRKESPLWRFTLHAPSYIPLMDYLEDEATRKLAWEASCGIGLRDGYDNTETVWNILALRHEKAQLLEKAHFSDWVLSNRMAKNGCTALQFIEGLHQKVRPLFLKEFEALCEFKAQKTGQIVTSLQPWEVSYWSVMQRREVCSFDDEVMRPYFPVDQVMSGMFELASKLFDISIQPRHDVEVWHPEVLFYEVYDQSTQVHYGSFYADWYPRESKRGGAWMGSLHQGGKKADGSFDPSLGYIVGNMSPPQDGKPALLTHHEVETIFHEFGHLLHSLLSEVSISSLAGTNVPWDFVELPSQLMENFCNHRISLNFFAKHDQTGEPIPDDVLQNLLKARHFQTAMQFMRQLCMAKLDLEIHQGIEPCASLDALDEGFTQEYRAGLLTPSPTVLRRFTHLFSGSVAYASGYYSYKWAEALDADAFTRFEADGIVSKTVGMEFRSMILSQGNSMEANHLFKTFMGRELDSTALLKRARIL